MLKFEHRYHWLCVHKKGQSVHKKGQSVHKKGQSVHKKGQDVSFLNHKKGQSVHKKGQNKVRVLFYVLFYHYIYIFKTEK